MTNQNNTGFENDVQNTPGNSDKKSTVKSTRTKRARVKNWLFRQIDKIAKPFRNLTNSIKKRFLKGREELPVEPQKELPVEPQKELPVEDKE